MLRASAWTCRWSFVADTTIVGHAPVMQRTTRELPFWNRKIVPYLAVGVVQ